MSTGIDFEPILSQFQGISLEEVDRASLMRRKDNKYLFSIRHMVPLLEMVKEDYRVLEIEGSRSQYYHTRYFDTDDREMYLKHHRGQANRHKVRIRRYGSGDVHFLEVKMKNAKGVTNKKRVRTNGMDHSVLLQEEEFLTKYSPYESRGIDAALENLFRRITLVSYAQTERVTLDYSLSFAGEVTGQALELPGVAIAEIKYEDQLSGSSVHAAMRKLRIKSSRFSKYAIGMALLHPELKQNRFKSRVRKVTKLNNQYQLTLK
jgi:hypothetical protein